MEDQSIQLRPTPRTHLRNFHAISGSARQEPEHPRLLPAGESLTMAEGDVISFADNGVWMQGVFTQETTVDGPLVFAHEPDVEILQVAKDYVREAQAIHVSVGLAVPYGLLMMAYLSFTSPIVIPGESTHHWFIAAGIGIFLAVTCAALCLYNVVSSHRRVTRNPGKFMRDRNLGQIHTVFIPRSINLPESHGVAYDRMTHG